MKLSVQLPKADGRGVRRIRGNLKTLGIAEHERNRRQMQETG